PFHAHRTPRPPPSPPLPYTPLSRSQRTLQVTNEFGPLRAEIGRPDDLLVPTAESLDSDPPLPAASDVDRYACHRLRLVTDGPPRSEEHTSELQSRFDLVCRLLLEKK